MPPFSQRIVGEVTEIGNKIEKKAVLLAWRALPIKEKNMECLGFVIVRLKIKIDPLFLLSRVNRKMYVLKKCKNVSKNY